MCVCVCVCVCVFVWIVKCLLLLLVVVGKTFLIMATRDIWIGDDLVWFQLTHL